MAIPRLARLQKRILQWLAADHHRTKGVIRSSHEELVKAVGGYKGNVSRSLQTLETRGWINIAYFRQSLKKWTCDPPVHKTFSRR